MLQVSLCVFTLALVGFSRAQDNNTVVVMDNEISNKIANPPPHDSMANMKYACSLTLEKYIDTGERNLTMVTKTRLAMVCCPGYKRDFRGICQPYCFGGCGDGFCESPGICSCNNNCAFNTVDRKCACFEAVCPGGCPANASCIADNNCDCNFGFVRKSNWTSQYTNSTAECIPYCYPFCTNKLMSSSTEHCVCNYTQASANGTTFNKDDPLGNFDRQNKSPEYLGHLFQSHGHPSFTSGLTGFALGALVGHMMGNFGKSKNKYGKGGNVYGMPGGYGMYGNNPYGGGNYGHGYPGGYPNVGHNAGNNYGHNNPYGGTYGHSGVNYGQGIPPNYGQGVPPNYGQGVPPNTHYGQGVPPNTHYGQSVPNTNYGQGVPPNTNYGNNAQYPRQPAPSAPVQNTGIASGVPVQSQPGHGTPGQPGWNVPGTDVQQKTSNTYSSAPGQPGKVAPSAPHLDSGTNAGTGQRTNYGWNTPSNTNTGSNTNYGWNVPSSSNTGSNTGTSNQGKTSGSSWPWSTSGGGSGGTGTGSSGRGKGSSGRKRGRKH